MDSCLSRISDNQVARISFFCGMKVIKKMRIFHMKQHYCAHFGKNQNSVKHEKTKVLMKAEDTFLLNHWIHPINFASQESSVAGLERGFLHQPDIDDI